MRDPDNPGVEWVKYPYEQVGGWRLCQVAINGQLASFELREEDYCQYPTEASRNAMLIRLAKSYLAEFGDFQLQRR